MLTKQFTLDTKISMWIFSTTNNMVWNYIRLIQGHICYRRKKDWKYQLWDLQAISVLKSGGIKWNVISIQLHLSTTTIVQTLLT